MIKKQKLERFAESIKGLGEKLDYKKSGMSNPPHFGKRKANVIRGSK